jgi:hypothetical protein
MSNIDKLFKNAFDGARQEPPGYMWGKIAEGMGAAAGRKRKMLIWYAAASIAIMAAFTSGYYLASKQSENVMAKNTVEDRSIPQHETLTKNNTLTEEKNIQETTPEIHENTSLKPEVNQPIAQISSSKISDDQMQEKNVAVAESKLLEKMTLATVPIALALLDRQPKEVIQKIDEPREFVEDFKPIGIEPVKQSRWSMALNAGPLYAYRDVKNQGSNIFLLAGAVPDNFTARNSNSDKSYYDQIESPLLAYSGGVNVNYKAGKRIYIESGLFYSKTGQKTEEMFVYEENNQTNSTYEIINSSAGDVVNNQKSGMLMEDLQSSHTYMLSQNADGSLLYMNSSDLVLNFDFLEVPLVVKYKLIDRKLDVLLSGGISTAFLVGNSAYVSNSEDRIFLGSTENIRKVNYSASASIALQYELTKNIAFQLEPVFRYSMQAISKEYYIRSHPYSIRFLSGVNYLF